MQKNFPGYHLVVNLIDLAFNVSFLSASSGNRFYTAALSYLPLRSLRALSLLNVNGLFPPWLRVPSEQR